MNTKPMISLLAKAPRSTKPLAAALAFMAALFGPGCQCGNSKLIDSCIGATDCTPGSVCYESSCRQECTTSADCDDACTSGDDPTGSSCQDGKCLPGCSPRDSGVLVLFDAGQADAGQPRDASVADGGVDGGASASDGGADAGRTDAGRVDAGFDAGVPPLVCDGGQHAENEVCVSNWRVGNCQGVPVHAISNTTDTLDQEWDVDAGRWMPPWTRMYNTEPSTTECRYYCMPDFHWDGQSCTSDHPSRCYEERVNGVSVTSWYSLDAGMKGELREVCDEPPRGLPCADRDGCCGPGGVAINGHCVVYEEAYNYCYASPACLLPLTCNSMKICVP